MNELNKLIDRYWELRREISSTPPIYFCIYIGVVNWYSKKTALKINALKTVQLIIQGENQLLTNYF